MEISFRCTALCSSFCPRKKTLTLIRSWWGQSLHWTQPTRYARRLQHPPQKELEWIQHALFDQVKMMSSIIQLCFLSMITSNISGWSSPVNWTSSTWIDKTAFSPSLHGVLKKNLRSWLNAFSHLWAGPCWNQPTMCNSHFKAVHWLRKTSSNDIIVQV